MKKYFLEVLKLPFTIKVKKSTSGLNLPIANEAFFNSPNVEKEIKRVFQMANRRVQNLKNAKVVSPALKALELATGKTDKFTVFSFSKNDLLTTSGQEKLAYSWGQAVAFLHNPTSTALGARQYTKEISNELNVSKDRASEILDYLTDTEIDFMGNIHLINYRDTLNKIRTESKNDANAINWSAANWKNQVMQALQKESSNIDKALDNFANSFLSSFYGE